MKKQNFKMSDETRNPSQKTNVEVLKTEYGELHRAVFQPGWRWSVDIKPVAGTDSCQVHHLLLGLSGRLNTVMNDGTEIEMGAGEVLDILPGHDGWVVGDEPFECIDIGPVITSFSNSK